MVALDAGVKFSHKTSTATVLTGNGKLYGYSFKATSATGTMKIYDNTSASGTVIVDVGMALAGDSLAADFSRPIDFGTGLHVVLSNGIATLRYMDGAYA